MTMTLQELSDLQAIRDVLSRYCEILDEWDFAEIQNIFTPDCVSDYGPSRGGSKSGPEAVVQMMKQIRVTTDPQAIRRTHHQLGQIRITLKDNQASSIAYATADHELNNGERRTIRLQYRDQFNRTADGWRISYRKLVATIVDGDEGTQRHRLTRVGQSS